METSQRFLRRLHLLSKMENLLREATYYRNHGDAVATDKLIVWKWDEDIGEAKIDDNTREVAV